MIEFTLGPEFFKNRAQTQARWQAGSLPVGEAINAIRSYYKKSLEDPHDWDLSYQHCYRAFAAHRGCTDAETLDYLALHLAFYLASWGMLRSSAFLSRKDYKIHAPVVKIIMEERYAPLAGIYPEELVKEKNLDLLEEIGGRVRKAYALERPSVKGKINKASDTLVTKILMGTLGCTVAFDRYLVQSVKKYKISGSTFNKNSVRDIAQFYLAHEDEFEAVRAEITARGVACPPMKMLDVCLWQHAYDEEQNEKSFKEPASE